MSTIYERSPRSSPYTIVVGGKPLNEWLGGWMANSVIVDNHASQHLLLPDVGIYCPPLTVGKIVPLTGLGRVQALFATPPGYTTSPAKVGQICNLTFYAEDLPPHPGVADGVLGVNSPRQQLWPDSTSVAQQTGPSFQMAANGILTKTFTLPTGTTDLRIAAIITGGSTAQFVYSITIRGHTTNIRYYPKQGIGLPVDPLQPITVPVDIEYDHAIDVTIGGDPTNGLDIYVSALTQVEAVEVYTQEPQLVTFSSVALQPQPALWQAANNPPFSIDAVVAAGANLVIVPAVALQTVYLFGLQAQLQGAAATAFGAWQDTAGAEVGSWDASPAPGTPVSWSGGGAFLNQGQGFRLHNGGSTAVTANGILSASQG